MDSIRRVQYRYFEVMNWRDGAGHARYDGTTRQCSKAKYSNTVADRRSHFRLQLYVLWGVPLGALKLVCRPPRGAGLRRVGLFVPEDELCCAHMFSSFRFALIVAVTAAF